jgi:hypothetical protein
MLAAERAMFITAGVSEVVVGLIAGALLYYFARTIVDKSKKRAYSFRVFALSSMVCRRRWTTHLA